MSVMSAAEQERRDLVELLSTLTPEQWDAPTLCAQWRVRDVVAHIVSYEVASPRAIATRAVRGRLVLSRMNRTGVAELRERPPAELLRLLRDNLQPRGLSTAFGGRVALIDALIHHQDIRRPLGLPREVVGETDFDIAADGTAYVAFNVYDTGLRARSTTLYRVDLATGAATRLGPLGNGRVSIFGLAVAPD